jgi:hypothetical protein
MQDCDGCVVMKQTLQLIEKRVDAIESAFPDQDFAGHCRSHLALIEDVQARKALARAIKEKTISGLIWVAIVAVGALLLSGLKVHVAKWF